MRRPRLAELQLQPPSEKALAWVREMRGVAYSKRYLRSRLWREVIRPAVFERDNYECTVCKKAARHVHHLSYDEATLLGHSLEKLQSVCAEHHESAHLGSPDLQEVPLRTRFVRVKEEHRQKVLLEKEFLKVGSRLIVKAKLSHGWWKCVFDWEPEPRHRTVADLSNRWFFLGARRDLDLAQKGYRPWQKSGVRFTAKCDRLPSMTFHWGHHDTAPGVVKLRASRFPDWIRTFQALTTWYPFPVLIVAENGERVKSGGCTKPPFPNSPRTIKPGG